MKIHEKAMNLLKEIYTVCSTQRAYELDRQSYTTLSSEDRHELDQLMDYLQSRDFIDNFAPCVGSPISVKITSRGIDAIEGIVETYSATNNIVLGNNYGITGNHAVGNTISSGISFEDIKSLIAVTVNSQQDQKVLIEALKPLYDRMEIGAPIEKGVLSSIGDKLHEYQPLLTAIASSLLPYLMGK